MRSERDLVVSGGVVAERVHELHLYRPDTAAPESTLRPLLLGTLPAPADCYRHRPAVEGAPAAGPVVLSGPAGSGKTQAAAHHARLALREGMADVVLWADADNRASLTASYARAAGRLGQEETAESLIRWLTITGERWLIVLDGLTDPALLAELGPPPSACGRVVVTTRSGSNALHSSLHRVIRVGPFTAEEAAGYLADRLALHEWTGPYAELTHGLDPLPAALAEAAGQLIDRADGHPALRRDPGRTRRPAGCPLCDPPGAGPGDGLTFALRHAPGDRLWARWTEAVLTRAGLRPARGTPADRTITLLSPALPGSPATEGPPGPGHVVARIAPAVLPADHGALPLAELTGHDPAAAAAELLAALGIGGPVPDLTGLRHPGTAPAHLRLPPRHPSFTGRDAVLDHLHEQLGGGPTAVLPLSQTLYGLGGIGKTQIALEYAHRYRSEYDLVWWIDAEQTESVVLAMADLAHRLGLPVGDSVAEAAEAAREALGRGVPTDRWLLVLDNADDPADVRPYFPDGPGRILLTSRNLDWTRVADALEVDVFSRAESVEHLRRRVRGLSADDAATVADALGDLPLAVEVAAAWLDATAMPVEAYLAELRPALTAEGAFDYPRSVAATWHVSIGRLRVESPAAARLLQLCAYFAPEPIAARLLYSGRTVQVLSEHDPGCTSVFAVSAAVRALGRYSLARVDAGRGTVQLHRLVQAVVRHAMSERESEIAVHQVHQILNDARPTSGGIDDPANWPAFSDLWPHLAPSLAYLCDETRTRQLHIDRLRYLWKRGDLTRARRLGYDLDAVWTDRLGTDDRQTLQLRFQLANVLRSAGDHAAALSLDETILGSQRRVLGEQDPDTLATAGSLAADLRSAGRFRDALDLDLEVWDNVRRLYPEDHPRVLTAANNLAIDHRLLGDDRAAHELDLDTFERRSRVLGARHPYTLASRANVARELRELGDLRGSADLLRETVDTLAEVLAPDVLDNLRTTVSLAVALRRTGELSTALALTRRTYDRFLARYGPDVPDALVCALSLAADLGAAGRRREALGLAEEALDRHRRVLGGGHPFTLAAAAGLAVHLRRCGQVAEAAGVGEETVRALLRTLGPDHPITLVATVNLAEVRMDQDRPAQAVELLRDALGRLRAHRGPRHPDALLCAAALARALRAIGPSEEAETLHASAVDGLRRLLGEEHPDTVAVRDGRAVDRLPETQPV
ncbi:FxSxx-COOH system tetratricopeptide repeat protein [Kitasatospora sp. NPDC004240]